MCWDRLKHRTTTKGVEKGLGYLNLSYFYLVSKICPKKFFWGDCSDKKKQRAITMSLMCWVVKGFKGNLMHVQRCLGSFRNLKKNDRKA